MTPPARRWIWQIRRKSKQKARGPGEQTVAVYESADRSFKYTIPAKSIASFRWGAGAEN